MENLETLTYRIYTTKSENDKAINSLKGLLSGINLDGEVNDREILELNQWVEKHETLVSKNPFKEFMQIIRESINNGIPNNEVIEDLYWLCQKYEQGNYYYNAVTADLQTLQGLCHGILSDGIINDEEIFMLNKWLEANDHLTTYYPYDELRSLLLSITSDHKVDEEERLVLQAYFNQFVKLNNQEMASKGKRRNSKYSYIWTLH
ncbi:hypothetical protein [Flavobacterium sp.]|uniref:hypothetical protein n=1 Tax=Flavobacterium sp. TaxID=239 RepID=UPI0039E61AA3